jgi:hypothetical protein
MIERFRILPGLPGTGPVPEQFSATGHGMHSEGFVVEFLPEQQPPWVGNFQRGLISYDAVWPLPNGKPVIVISGGQAYVIDPEERRLLATFGGQICTALPAPHANLLILGHLTYLEAWNSNAVQWKTPRISWDGIRDLKVEQDYVRGLAWSPIEDCQIPFSVDLKTGMVEGGAYPRAG